MVRLILISVVLFTLIGCGNRVQNIKVVEKFVPVNSVPMPPDTKRPILFVDKLSEDDKSDTGKVAKAYKISIKQLQAYANVMELIVDEYRHMAIQSKKDIDLLQQFTPNLSEMPIGPLSSANPEDGEVTFSRVVVEPMFNFQHEYDKWQTEQRFDELQAEMDAINSPNYLNIDNE